MGSLPGQLSLFEVETTAAEPVPSSARVGVEEAVHAARVIPGASGTVQADATRRRSRERPDPRDALSPRHVAERGPSRPSPVSATLLSPEDVARRCGLSRKAVYRAVASGELRAARILSRLRIDPSDVEAWFRANIVEPERPAPSPAAARSPASRGLRRLLPGT